MEEMENTNSGKMTFGDAIEAMKAGAKVARRGWNGKDMYIYLRCASAQTPDPLSGHSPNDSVRNAHFAMKTADGSVCVGWLASQSDMLADDWMLIH